MISDTDKAYIAGLFDGEGSVFFKRATEKKKRKHTKVMVIDILCHNELVWK